MQEPIQVGSANWQGDFGGGAPSLCERLDGRTAIAPTVCSTRINRLLFAQPRFTAPSIRFPMDRTYIQSQRIVDRYLSGDLSVREAREFEKFCGDNPDILNSLPIPVRVKARMARKPGAEMVTGEFDPTATDTSIVAAGLEAEDDDDDAAELPPARGFRGLPQESRRWVVVFGVLFAIATVGAGALWVKLSAAEKQLSVAQRAAKAVQIRAPGDIRTVLTRVVAAQPSSPTLDIGAPSPPQLIELRVDMSEARYNLFQITIDSVEGGRVAQFRRVARDSNREVRLSLNTSAFPGGDYDVQFEGHTGRGDEVRNVGWIRLGMK